MKRSLIIISVIISLSSCGVTAPTTIYYGSVDFYMPDGTVNTYNAYMRDDSNTVYCDWGDGKKMITNGIPYKFIGSREQNGEGKDYVSYNYEDKTYQIPMEIWKSIQTLSVKDNKLNQKVAKKLVEEYIARIYPQDNDILN